MKKITVLLAEDHMIVREGLRALLKLESDIEVIGEAENGRQAVSLTGRLHPDVLVMDIAMPLLNGLEAARQILRTASPPKVLILSAHSDDPYVRQVIALGASGFLIKQTAAHNLSEAIRQVFAGNQYFSPAVSRRLTKEPISLRPRRGSLPTQPVHLLSSREMEILQLIAEGKANKESAGLLSISIKTVEKHRQTLMEKLNIHDTAGLTRYAIAAGVIESSVQVTIV